MPHAVRLVDRPIISPELDPSIGTNINGPSLIRAPRWLAEPLGRYYLYFADHGGTFIRLAVADELTGPWRVHTPGTLHLRDTPFDRHIASPDVRVDDANRQVVMYYHGAGHELATPVPEGQTTCRATSSDGLSFRSEALALGASYFRVFRWRSMWYALSNRARLWRSGDDTARFEPHPTGLGEALCRPREMVDRDDRPRYCPRHTAVRRRDDVLEVYFSRIGDAPEHLLMARVPLADDWCDWRPEPPVSILHPQPLWEGADRPVEPSAGGAGRGRVCQLRDPAIFEDDDRTYLLYSVAGESGIGIAEVLPDAGP